MAPLTEKEIEALRKLVPHVDVITKEAKYQAALNLVWRHWKGLIIAIAGALTAGFLIWDKLKTVGMWFFR